MDSRIFYRYKDLDLLMSFVWYRNNQFLLRLHVTYLERDKFVMGVVPFITI